MVEGLISHNNKTFANDKIIFECKDASIEDIAYGDILIIKEVLQYLDDNSVMNIIKKFNNYKYVIILDGVDINGMHNSYEIDNIIGGRESKNNGLYFDEKPYNLPIYKIKILDKPEFQDNFKSILWFMNNTNK